MKPLAPCLHRCLIALAVLGAFATAAAAEEETSTVDAHLSVGAAAVSGDPADRALFGLYNGLRDERTHGLLDFGYLRRDALAGTWAEVVGRNLLLDTRELGLSWQRQGRWRIGADYAEQVRREPLTVNTGLIGAGRVTPQVVHLGGGPGSGAGLDLQTRRKGLGAEFARWISPTLSFEARLERETRDGARLFGVGFSCPTSLAIGCGPTTATQTGSAVLLVPEPIGASHSQAQARLTYGGERLTLSAGYYGSFFSNDHGTLRPAIPGVLNNPLGAPLPLAAGLQAQLASPVALAPDNHAHQLDLTGTYAFAAATRASFRFAYTMARQEQDFAGAGLASAPAGVSHLGARVDTSLAHVAVTTRPLPRLSLAADWRFEERDDDTPLARYVVEGALVTTNRRESRTRNRGKVQATLRLPYRLAASAGLDYEFIDRGALTPTHVVRGVSALRRETEEFGYRLELRRQMTETVSGSIVWSSARRDGSAWLRPNATGGATEVDPATGLPATAIFAPHLADRERDKLRLFALWQASERLSLNLALESGQDRFDTPTRFSLRDSRVELASVDAFYSLSEVWSVNGHVSYGRQQLDQARPEGYLLAFDNRNTSAGLGLNGKLGERLDLGAVLSYLQDRSDYGQSLDGSASAALVALLNATGGLPQILFRRSELRLYGQYALGERSSLRLDALYQKARFNDWAYGHAGVPFVFGDNTIVSMLEQQDIAFVGLRYTLRWR